MSATFTTKITGLRTATVNNIENVVKQIEWTMQGTQDNQKFELPQTTTVPDPQSEQFIPIQQLTEQEVISWIETHDERLPAIRAHIQYVLDKETAKAALMETPMPWAPAPVPANPETVPAV